MPEQAMSNEKQPAEKPFPWRCPKCRQLTVNRVTMPYRCQRTRDGRVVTVEVPNLAVPRCPNCGEVVFDYSAHEQIRAALRPQFEPVK
jgi:ribosomal protein L37AE/L43A